MTRILVVEDDMTVSEVVVRYLQREGFVVEAVADGRVALDRAREAPPDAVVLDLMLPGIDGLEVFRRLRALAPTPVIMLTARGDESDRVLGLEMGADDYVSKPFSPRELTARVKSVLRRAAGGASMGGASMGGASMGTDSEVLTAGAIAVDTAAREVRVGGEVVSVTGREFDLLAFLMRRPRQVFRREDLLEGVWGYTYGDTSTVTVHIRRLREKVEADPGAPVHLMTVWGAGYRFDP